MSLRPKRLDSVLSGNIPRWISDEQIQGQRRFQEEPPAGHPGWGGHLAGLATLARVREYLCVMEVGTIIRVVRKYLLAFRQITRVIERNETYRPIWVTTLEEAEERLAGKEE